MAERRPEPVKRRRWRIRAAMLTATAVAIAAGVVGLVGPWYGGRANGSDHGVATTVEATAAVQRRTLTAQTTESGTLEYRGSRTVIGQLPGTVTWLPQPGRVVRQGQTLYRVDERPVVLLYGNVPAYRDLAEGLAGDDVRQLNKALVRLGYAHGLGLDPNSDTFGWLTRAAVENLQKASGMQRTGKLSRGQVVFLPGPIRVTNITAQLGTPAAGQVLTGTSLQRVVNVKLNVAQQAQVHVGDRVTITLPDGSTAAGRISSIGKVASSGSGNSVAPTVPVVITPTRPAATGSWEQAPVQVAITTATVRDALVVPVTALLALAGGGYAVEVVDSTSAHTLVPVELGQFDDRYGLVQVTGDGLAVGDHVVVPTS